LGTSAFGFAFVSRRFLCQVSVNHDRNHALHLSTLETKRLFPGPLSPGFSGRPFEGMGCSTSAFSNASKPGLRTGTRRLGFNRLSSDTSPLGWAHVQESRNKQKRTPNPLIFSWRWGLGSLELFPLIQNLNKIGRAAAVPTRLALRSPVIEGGTACGEIRHRFRQGAEKVASYLPAAWFYGGVDSNTAAYSDKCAWSRYQTLCCRETEVFCLVYSDNLLNVFGKPVWSLCTAPLVSLAMRGKPSARMEK
jgi:hypothetical protein